MNDSGTHIKTAVFVVLGFVVCAMLGQQISIRVNPPTQWSPFYWSVFGTIGGAIGACVAET
jgi:hypothetical protein